MMLLDREFMKGISMMFIMMFVVVIECVLVI